jgi:hypothetical protein
MKPIKDHIFIKFDAFCQKIRLLHSLNKDSYNENELLPYLILNITSDDRDPEGPEPDNDKKCIKYADENTPKEILFKKIFYYHLDAKEENDRLYYCAAYDMFKLWRMIPCNLEQTVVIGSFFKDFMIDFIKNKNLFSELIMCNSLLNIDKSWSIFCNDENTLKLIINIIISISDTNCYKCDKKTESINCKICHIPFCSDDCMKTSEAHKKTCDIIKNYTTN